MLLRFTQADVLNSELIDVHANRTSFAIFTRTFSVKTLGGSVAMISRKTTISDASGQILASIDWTGEDPGKKTAASIQILDEEPVDLTDFFDGSVSVPIM